MKQRPVAQLPFQPHRSKRHPTNDSLQRKRRQPRQQPLLQQQQRHHGLTINFVKLVIGLTIFRRWRTVHGTEGQPSPAAGFAMALPKGPASPNNNTNTRNTPTADPAAPLASTAADRIAVAVTGGTGERATRTGSTISTTAAAALPLVATIHQPQCKDQHDGKTSGKSKKAQRTKSAGSVGHKQKQPQPSAAAATALDLANGNTLSTTEQNAMVNGHQYMSAR